MILFYSFVTACCLLVLIAGVDVFLYQDSMGAALTDILMRNNTTGKTYAYSFFFMMFLGTVALDLYRTKK